MYEVRFNIDVTLKRYREIRGSGATQVIVTSHHGKKIQFLTAHLIPFVTETGIKGQFRILFSEENKFVRMEKI